MDHTYNLRGGIRPKRTPIFPTVGGYCSFRDKLISRNLANSDIFRFNARPINYRAKFPPLITAPLYIMGADTAESQRVTAPFWE